MMNFYYLNKDQKRCKSNDGSNKLIQGVSDHFECKISSQNGLKQTHSMAVIMTLEHETVEKPLRAFELLRHNTKTEQSSLPFEDFPIQQCQGPINSSMPKSEATSKILPLHVLAKTALSLRRTNDNDIF